MASKRKPGRPVSGKPPTVRATVSLPRDVYQTLVDLAKHKKVSLAWVVREAAEKYVAEQWPLFGTHQ